jgi:hypothetical protein
VNIVPILEASFDVSECCEDAMKACSVMFSSVRGSIHPWTSRSVLAANSDKLRGGAQCTRRWVRRKASQSGLKSFSSAEAVLRHRVVMT